MNFLDTNALLESVVIDYPIIISSVTLEELESIKTSYNKDSDIKYKARQALRSLNDHDGEYNVIIYDNEIKDMLAEYGLTETPDNKICACAAYCVKNGQEIVFITNDLSCKVIARNIFKLNTRKIANAKESIYKGYKIIHGNTKDINSMLENIEFDDWCTNEYLIIENIDDGSSKEMRFDGDKFVPLKLPPSKYIKGKNALQRCALDILMNPDITIAAILGGYGSGKSFLTMKMAVYQVREKGNQSVILGVREPYGEGKEVGFLPGSLDDKTDQFFLPLVQQLDGGKFEVEQLKQQGFLESTIPFYMKGCSYNNTIIMVDEAEDLTDKQMKLIGTRLAENSRVFFNGDYKQSVINASESNALVKVCNELKGYSNFACIYLGEDVRSEASRMFANLFD